MNPKSKRQSLHYSDNDEVAPQYDVPLIVMGEKCTFEEVGRALVLPAIQGENGKLFQDGFSISGELSNKVRENEDLTQLFMCCIVAASYFTYLVTVLKASSGELKEFDRGVRKGFEEIQLNKINYFGKEQVDSWMKVINWYTKQYIDDLGNDPDDFILDGRKPAANLVKLIYKELHINYDHPDEIANRMLAGNQIDIITSSTVEALRSFIERR